MEDRESLEEIEETEDEVEAHHKKGGGIGARAEDPETTDDDFEAHAKRGGGGVT